MNVISGGSERPSWPRGLPAVVLPEPSSRRALATSQDMARGLFFQGLLKAIRVLGDEALAARCAAACGQSGFCDFFNYPIRLFLDVVDTALSPLMERHGEESFTLWLMGHCVATDFLESEAGRAMQVLVRGEVRRLVQHLPATYQVSMDGTRSVEWLGPRHCRLRMSRDFAPVAFHEGLLVAMLERTGAHGVRVVGRRVDALQSEYELSWE